MKKIKRLGSLEYIIKDPMLLVRKSMFFAKLDIQVFFWDQKVEEKWIDEWFIILMSSEDQLFPFDTKAMAQRLFFFLFQVHVHCYLTFGSEVVDPDRTFSKEYHHQTHTGIDIGSVTNILILPFFRRAHTVRWGFGTFLSFLSCYLATCLA